jgi:hypothetical protein
MSINPVAQAYKARYSDLNFERLGLFKLVSDTFDCKEVLYPGCSIHITPSFIFPHVVYVDKSQSVREFFANRELLIDFIARNRVYKRKPYFQFIHQDFSEPLSFEEGSFDLLISLFSINPITLCEKYLRKGGLLLTNQREEADGDFKPVCSIRFQRGKYQIVSGTDVAQKEPKKKYLRQANRGLEYIEKENYFVFERV